MKYRLDAFDHFTDKQKQEIEDNLNLTGYERRNLEDHLEQHISFVERIKSKVFELLEAKLDGFSVLAHLLEQNEIDVYLIGGTLLVSNAELKP